MYWLVSLPHGGQPDRVWNQLQELTTYTSDYSHNFKFALPESFRVGTLDSLLGLSDDLAKVNAAVEGTVNKVRRQLMDLQSSVAPEDRADVWVEGQTPEGYLQRFAWNEAKYPSRRPLKDIVSSIMDTVQKLDDDLKLKVTEFGQLRSQLQASARKQQGSLAVRDLSGLVAPGQLVDTENLTTLMVVVGKQARNDWLAQYEGLTEFVVPRSSEVVAEDQDYLVFSVVLFRRVVDNFKTAARTKGFQVKEVRLDPEGQRSSDAELARVRQDADAKRAALEQWCITSYGEAFSSWIHICAVRLFVESILRYGLPPQFHSVLMRPNPKQISRLRKVMESAFSGVGSHHFSTEGAGGDDMFPYVSFTLNIEG
ncbi:V-type proton ATPase subunit C [Chlorella sorokiniana]|jgi:V-type H+-transporting ATPase subunit C|uniref:V-type proton ATPase subunit C n=1 Tax=Chlorella sorokiniana TaxID=3076 RepID=A0A2P6TTK6_CHLSO|nr:V-type proton ATPase subunit C [Chlorella sorokiniana]|eukprot:PRW57395.1 V-type proton ATPase subunit C [Chlorella sorokiniana]